MEKKKGIDQAAAIAGRNKSDLQTRYLLGAALGHLGLMAQEGSEKAQIVLDILEKALETTTADW